MIQGFEEYTHELDDKDKLVLPHIISMIYNAVGKDNVISNMNIRRRLGNNHNLTASPARVRKMINFIRNKGIVQNVLASSKGYYTSTSVPEITFYIESLMQRANAIISVANALHNQKQNLE